MRSLITPASADQATVIKKQFDELDAVQPYKLVTSKGSERFFTEEAALVSFKKHKGNALLSFNQPGKPQTFIAYKYR